MLYRQVGDAAPGIQFVGGNDGVSGADVEAGPARTASIDRLFIVHRQWQVGEKFSKEKPRTGLFVQKQRVLGDPA